MQANACSTVRFAGKSSQESVTLYLKKNCTTPTRILEKSMADKSLPLAGQCVITTDAEVVLAAFSVEPTRSPPRITRPQH